MPDLRMGMLVLEDGSAFLGRSVGAEGEWTGEVVFNTSLTGYQEVITDASYWGQMVVFTCPHIGNVGINLGVAAPMAFFPFSGWKESFFGTLHGQGKHAVEFFTQTKVVVERWPKEWSRTF